MKLLKMAPTLKVAVIGAGVAGLTTARDLKSHGHQVVVYEKSAHIGGMWLYDPEVETDPLCLDPHRKIVHGSLYSSLRANLPYQCMGFSDYSFVVKDKNGEIRKGFPGHEEMLQYLNDFARDFGLFELIRFNTEVVRVKRAKTERWMVESRTSCPTAAHQFINSEELFDAVVVCNGHHTEPSVAQLPGMKNWPGKQIHSHNYRVPKPYKDQVVVVIGDGFSAMDISLEIAGVAKEVHLSSRSPKTVAKKLEMYENLWQHSKVENCYENGEIAFEDGSYVHADIILHCSGYKYHFPFMKTDEFVTIDENRVGPLYKHVFPPEFAPTLSFIGIPRGAINIPMIELQGKWVAAVLSGKVALPTVAEMLADVQEHYRLLEENGVPKHHTHTLDQKMGEYLDWLAAQVGVAPLDEDLKDMFYKLIEIIDTPNWVGYREQFIQ